MLTRVDIDYSRSLIDQAEVRLAQHRAAMFMDPDDAHVADLGLSLLHLMEARLIIMRKQHGQLVKQRALDMKLN